MILPNAVVDEISTLYEDFGHGAYFGEAVSELEHALQTAALARERQAPENLILASLLHDIGHMLHRMPENIAEFGIDAKHETIGAAWLAQKFDKSLTEPIRLHVDAKRYLCTREPEYLSSLSAASTKSLQLQGGVMSPEECLAFEQKPYWQDAVQLRRWDEQAKVAGLDVPAFKEYRSLLLSAVGKRS